MSTTDANSPPNSSGKKLVTTLILLGVIAAAVALWFRYSTTRRSAEFWGSPASTLINSAPHVSLQSDTPSADAEGVDEADVPRDISMAKGLTHLRNRLLMDASYDWTTKDAPDTNWNSSLVFAAAEGAEPRAVVLFSSDYEWVGNGTGSDPTKNALKTTSEMATGLRTFFAEETGAPAEQ